MDIVFVILLALIIVWGCNRAGNKMPLDFATVLLSFVLYGLTKMAIIWVGWGLTFPVTKDPTAHTVSGVCSLVFWAVMLYFRPFVWLRRRWDKTVQ